MSEIWTKEKLHQYLIYLNNAPRDTQGDSAAISRGINCVTEVINLTKGMDEVELKHISYGHIEQKTVDQLKLDIKNKLDIKKL
jgi:hypothetical protein